MPSITFQRWGAAEAAVSTAPLRQAVRAAVLAVEMVRQRLVVQGHPGRETQVGGTSQVAPSRGQVAEVRGQLVQAYSAGPVAMAGWAESVRSLGLLCFMAAEVVVVPIARFPVDFQALVALAEVVTAMGLGTALMARMALAVEGVASDTPDKGAAEDLGL